MNDSANEIACHDTFLARLVRAGPEQSRRKHQLSFIFLHIPACESHGDHAVKKQITVAQQSSLRPFYIRTSVHSWRR